MGYYGAFFKKVGGTKPVRNAKTKVKLLGQRVGNEFKKVGNRKRRRSTEDELF